MKKKKLLIAGPYPPPYGGVSMHIKRLEEQVSGAYDIDVIDESRVVKENIFNIRTFSMGKYLLKVIRTDIVHIHSGILSFRLLHYCTAGIFFKKRVITIHGYEPGRGFIEKSLDRIMLNHCSRAIFVSKEIAGRLPVRKYIIKDAFLPPDIDSEEQLPGEISSWIEKKKAQGFAICTANAWRLDSHKNEDVYGLDLCILAAKKLKDQGIKAAFIFIVCEDTGVIPVSPYKEMIKAFALEDCFLLFESPLSFIRLILESDIVLRPTNTDGDALTVREGLYMGKTVIASDVVQRPQGTILFRNRDIDSLAREIEGVIHSDKKEPGKSDEYADHLSSPVNYYVNNIYS